MRIGRADTLASMRKKLASPLPKRHGLDAARLKLPSAGPWPTVRDHLVERLPRVDPARIDAMFAERRFHGADGPLSIEAPFTPDGFVWFHRDLPVEVPVPFDIEVVHRDEDILVVHKPHFLATIPRGAHILQTALVRLRQTLDLPDLSPAHRLDRVTAGLLLFVVRPQLRGAYQQLFLHRRVHKEYEAVAPYRPGLELPRTVRSHIVKQRGVIAAQELPELPNAETRVELLETRHFGDEVPVELGRYRLLPRTGRTHQLRLHMSGLGLPILGDRFYPVVQETPLDDFSRPLQLLAKVLEFVDPISGEPRRFTSPAGLQSWTAYDDWAR